MIRETCKTCGKIAKAVDKSRCELLEVDIYTLECGHIILESIADSLAMVPLATENTKAKYNGRGEIWGKLRNYQQTGVEFIESTNYNTGLLDDMGLGKTVQVITAIAQAKANLYPTLVVVRSSVKYQWAQHIIRWGITKDKLATFEDITSPSQLAHMIQNTKQMIVPGFNWYIISMDLLSTRLEELREMKFKCVVIDECHNFKDRGAQRTKALTSLVRDIPHKLFLSGTPILNRATEYFTILNMLDPLTFYSYQGFCRQWCDFDYGRNKFTSIRKSRRAEFERVTSQYMIRRLKSEVAKDLPSFERYVKILDIDDPLFKKAYKAGQDDLAAFMLRAQSLGKLEKHTQMIALLGKLRHIVGMAKVNSAIEYVVNFLNSTNRKIAIGVHHKDVAETIFAALEPYRPVRITGGMSPEQKHSAQEQFARPESRVLLASTLTAGEGLNLQFCSDVVQIESQWNYERERQFENRFHRIGSTHAVEATALIARNSLDEWLTQLKEDKRKWINSAQKTDDHSEDSDEMFENMDIDFEQLANMVISHNI